MTSTELWNRFFPFFYLAQSSLAWCLYPWKISRQWEEYWSCWVGIDLHFVFKCAYLSAHLYLLLHLVFHQSPCMRIIDQNTLLWDILLSLDTALWHLLLFWVGARIDFVQLGLQHSMEVEGVEAWRHFSSTSFRWALAFTIALYISAHYLLWTLFVFLDDYWINFCNSIFFPVAALTFIETFKIASVLEVYGRCISWLPVSNLFFHGIFDSCQE